jgi:nucleoid-associated protein YgaU
MLLLLAIMAMSCGTKKPARIKSRPVKEAAAPPAEQPAPVPPAEQAVPVAPVEKAPPAAPPPAPPPAAPPPTAAQTYEKYSGDIILEGAKTHRVGPGEDLSKIARRYYGGVNGYYFPLILLASRNAARDPDVLRPGMALTIPDLKRNLDDPGARQKLKEFLYEIADVYNGRLNTNWGAESRRQLRALAASL